MQPSVGRVVHVHDPAWSEQPCLAAIVTKVREQPGGSIDVMAFPPDQFDPLREVDLTERPFSDDDPPEGRHVATWHWPERIEEGR